jgi:MFS family permease
VSTSLPAASADGLSQEELEAQAQLGAARRVLSNPRFLALFLSQVLTQVGGNMVLYGLTIQVYTLTHSSTSVSILLLTFLVPAVIFGAVAGVYVDRYDRRLILVSTNLARAALFVVIMIFDNQLAILYAVTAVVATLTTFFAPAESAMIPVVVQRDQLLTANGIFIFALQASFVVGFAVLGPLFQNLLGTEMLITTVAAMYAVAGALCWTLPAAPPSAQEVVGGGAVGQAEAAIKATAQQLLEGFDYIRRNHQIFWSLTYLAVTASLIGVMGVLGPDFAVRVLNLREDDFVIIVLPLGVGLVVGIMLLNAYGKYVSRRRLIEAGLCVLAIALLTLGLAQRVTFQDGTISLLTVVIAVAFVAGVSYAFVAVPSQTALQEELPSDVRGRVFGVLNTLVSVASFLPIIIVGPVADIVGPSAVIVISSVGIATLGIVSFVFARTTHPASALPAEHLEPVDPMTVTSTFTLTRPTRIRYVEDEDGVSPLLYPSTPVVPGRAGPAPVAHDAAGPVVPPGAAIAPAPVGPAPVARAAGAATATRRESHPAAGSSLPDAGGPRRRRSTGPGTDGPAG